MRNTDEPILAVRHSDPDDRRLFAGENDTRRSRDPTGSLRRAGRDRGCFANRRIYRASGTVRARYTAAIAAKIAANILEIRVQTGDRVTAGQTLIVLDRAQPRGEPSPRRGGLRRSRKRHRRD